MSKIPTEPANEDADLSSDLLRGAADIAQFLFGDRKQRRRVYWLAGRGELPVFNIGDLICARKSTLRRHIAKKEDAAR